jgi:hypothetical protein
MGAATGADARARVIAGGAARCHDAPLTSGLGLGLGRAAGVGVGRRSSAEAATAVTARTTAAASLLMVLLTGSRGCNRAR